jgi:hypothetical protein
MFITGEIVWLETMLMYESDVASAKALNVANNQTALSNSKGKEKEISLSNDVSLKSARDSFVFWPAIVMSVQLHSQSNPASLWTTPLTLSYKEGIKISTAHTFQARNAKYYYSVKPITIESSIFVLDKSM